MNDIGSEEQILLEGERKTAASYQEAPTVVNMRAWNAAKVALEKFRETQEEAAAGVCFKNLSEVSRYLIRKGYKVQERTVRNHRKAGLFPIQPGNKFRQEDIDAYAKNHLDPPAGQDLAGAGNGHKDRLVAAQAEEREFRLAQLKGQLIDAAEEEARDARLWKAVRADIEQQAPGVINELVERVLALAPPEDLRHKVLAMIPELRDSYEDYLAEMFDRFARDGGIMVEQ